MWSPSLTVGKRSRRRRGGTGPPGRCPSWKRSREPVRESWMSETARRLLWQPSKPNAPRWSRKAAVSRQKPRQSGTWRSSSARIRTANGRSGGWSHSWSCAAIRWRSPLRPRSGRADASTAAYREMAAIFLAAWAATVAPTMYAPQSSNALAARRTSSRFFAWSVCSGVSAVR
jgi:hypothetical protein